MAVEGLVELAISRENQPIEFEVWDLRGGRSFQTVVGDRELFGHQLSAHFRLDSTTRANGFKLLLVSDPAETDLVHDTACDFVLKDEEKLEGY